MEFELEFIIFLVNIRKLFLSEFIVRFFCLYHPFTRIELIVPAVGLFAVLLLLDPDSLMSSVYSWTWYLDSVSRTRRSFRGVRISTCEHFPHIAEYLVLCAYHTRWVMLALSRDSRSKHIIPFIPCLLSLAPLIKRGSCRSSITTRAAITFLLLTVSTFDISC